MGNSKKLSLKTLKGVIVSYRKGHKTQKPRDCLLKFHRVETASEAASLMNRMVAWPVGDRKCKGKIVGTHGNKGVVRVRFRKGVPGQALGSPVEIII